MIGFGIIQIIFSQIPDFDQLWWLSALAAVMSFSYSIIGLGLGIGKIIGTLLQVSSLDLTKKCTKFHPLKFQFCFINAGNGKIKGSITGVRVGATVTQNQKVWRCFQSFGNIAFAYSYSIILIEIQV